LGVLGLAAYFVVRGLHGSPNRAIAAGSRRVSGRAASPQAAPAAPVQSPAARSSPYTDTGTPAKVVYGPPLMLKLFVLDQNTFIGKRNTHLVKPGVSFTVGGGNSDFLIFLVPVPANIGELKYESSGCNFYPRKNQYFPDTGSTPVNDCIGKNIRVMSEKGYELFFRFEQYEDPLLKLNRLMHSVNVPSPPPGETNNGTKDANTKA
jgi:hypothetical protein